MKLSLSTRIAEGFLSKDTALMPLDELAGLAADAGYEGLCMRPSQIGIDSPPHEVANAAAIVRDRALKVTMVTGGLDIVYNNARGPECLRRITPHLDLADALGAPLIRVCLKSEEDLAPARSAADEAAERGITLVQQCHVQSLFETVDGIVDVLRRIDRPNFRLIFEAANLEECRQGYGRETIRRLAPWIANVYLQNQRLDPAGTVKLDTWCAGPISFDIIAIPESGGIDFAEVMDGLRAIGYDGPLTVHQSAPEDGTSAAAAARATAAFLRGL